MAMNVSIKPGDKIKSKDNKEHVVLDVKLLAGENIYVMVEERKGWYFHIRQFKSK
jgi:hypothetical protein